MIGQSRRVVGGTGRANKGVFTRNMMWKTEIGGASNQIDAHLQGFEGMGRVTRFARQTGQSFSESSIQTLDKSCVEDYATTRSVKQLLRLLQETVSHPAGDLDHPFFLRPLDHSANGQFWPDLQLCAPNPTGQLDLLSERSANTVGVSTPAVCQDKQREHRLGRSANLGHQTVGQAAITRELDYSTQPQARRDHHSQSHPRNHFAPFHSYFVGLNMYQVKLSLLDDPLMHPLTMRSGSIAPIGDRPLIQAKSMHNRLDWTPIGPPGHDDHHPFRRLAQPLQHRSPTTPKRFFADLTPIAFRLPIMDPHIALSDLASCRTRSIRAKWFRRVPWLWWSLLHEHILPRTVAFFNPSSLHRIVGSYLSSCFSYEMTS